MNTLVATMIASLLMLGIAGAWAEEVQGRIKTTDPRERAFTLENGTRIWVAEGVRMTPVQAGREVMAIYEERDGKKIATTVELVETP